jgi:hypothetical protein
MRWAGYVVCINAKRILVGKAEEKGPLGRLIDVRVDNIKMDLRGIRRGGICWIDLVHDRDQCEYLVLAVMGLRVL